MSSEDIWDDASSDEDYQYQEVEDSEADSGDDQMDDDDHDDPSPFLNPGLAHHLLQQISNGTGIFATLGQAFTEWDDVAVDDFGVDQLLEDGENALAPPHLLWPG